MNGPYYMTFNGHLKQTERKFFDKDCIQPPANVSLYSRCNAFRLQINGQKSMFIPQAEAERKKAGWGKGGSMARSMYSYLSEQREDWLETPPVLYIKHKEEKWNGNYTNMLQGKKTEERSRQKMWWTWSQRIYIPKNIMTLLENVLRYNILKISAFNKGRSENDRMCWKCKS